MVTLEEARKALGETGKNMSDDEVLTMANNLQVLADSWLESYERTIFKGRTVNELLNDITPNLDEDEQKSQKKFKEYFKEWKARQKSTKRKSDKIKT